MKRITSRLTFANVVATLALVLVVTTSGVAQPVAQTAGSLSKDVKKALGLSKKANRTAKKALARARRAEKVASGVTQQGGLKGQKGDKGPQGDKGEQGATGPQGPIGPSEAIQNGRQSYMDWDFPLLGGDTRVESLNLKPGSYLVFAKGRLVFRGEVGPTAEVILTCELTVGPFPGATPLDIQRMDLFASRGNSDVGLFLAGTVKLTESDAVSLDCSPGGQNAEGMTLDGIVLAATRVGQVFRGEN
jgi:hypothetical protein